MKQIIQDTGQSKLRRQSETATSIEEQGSGVKNIAVDSGDPIKVKDLSLGIDSLKNIKSENGAMIMHDHFEEQCEKLYKITNGIDGKGLFVWCKGVLPLNLKGRIILLRLLSYLIPVGILIYSLKGGVYSSEIVVPVFSIFSLIIYHLSLSIKEMNILKNLEQTYLHRKIVAKTFCDFLKGINVGEKEAKAEMAKEAAIAMFQRVPSGYLSKVSSENSSPIQEVNNFLGNK